MKQLTNEQAKELDLILDKAKTTKAINEICNIRTNFLQKVMQYSCTGYDTSKYYKKYEDIFVKSTVKYEH